MACQLATNSGLVKSLTLFSKLKSRVAKGHQKDMELENKSSGL